MLGGQCGQHRKEAFLDGAGIERCEEHHQAAVRRNRTNLRRNLRKIGFDQLRLERSHRRDQGLEQIPFRSGLHAGTRAPVKGDEIDAVAAALCQHCEEEGCLDPGVQAGLILDPGR